MNTDTEANQVHLATSEELRERFETAELKNGTAIPAGGIPILSDGVRVTMNTEDTMTLILGATGSKKTRTLVAPLVLSAAMAEESMVLVDVKGEYTCGQLSPYVQGILREQGYRVRVLNFRDLNCDGWNLLSGPYRQYRTGREGDALAEVSHIVDALVGTAQDTADPFWINMAKQYLVSVTALLFELCDAPEQINLLTLAAFTNWEACENLRELLKQISSENSITTMLRGILSAPESTRLSVLATASSFLTPFLINEKLLRMLSQTTFEPEELYREKTALFLVIPDESDAYRDISGLLISQISASLVQNAYYLGGSLPRRVHFICDEFPQVRIPNMHKNIAAHRSRNIRWTIICQSRRQLRNAYPKEAAAIEANCTDLFFLGSPDPELLEELSLRAGTVTGEQDRVSRRLISVDQLRQLRKGRDYTEVFFASGATVCVTRLPDISLYQLVDGKEQPTMPESRGFPEPKLYSSGEMLRQPQADRRWFLLSQSECEDLTSVQLRAAKRYRKLFHNPIGIL